MRYFLSFMGEEHEVTKEQYIQAEQAAGFNSKFGQNEIATAGFGKGIVSGRVDYELGTDIIQ